MATFQVIALTRVPKKQNTKAQRLCIPFFEHAKTQLKTTSHRLIARRNVNKPKNKNQQMQWMKFMANRYVHPIHEINFNTMIARIIVIISVLANICWCSVCAPLFKPHCTCLFTIWMDVWKRQPANALPFQNCKLTSFHAINTRTQTQTHKHDHRDIYKFNAKHKESTAIVWWNMHRTTVELTIVNG